MPIRIFGVDASPRDSRDAVAPEPAICTRASVRSVVPCEPAAIAIECRDASLLPQVSGQETALRLAKAPQTFDECRRRIIGEVVREISRVQRSRDGISLDVFADDPRIGVEVHARDDDRERRGRAVIRESRGLRASRDLEQQKCRSCRRARSCMPARTGAASCSRTPARSARRA